MEKKRKLPARASARVESANKRRNTTSRDRSESETPGPSAAPASSEPTVEEEPPPPPLPSSIQAGKPLPTVDNAQSESLSSKDYQSISESGVLSESLSRSRHKWISDGLFEKYWTKPVKRKGVINEDPKNPPKDSMTKVGTVTITIEPHIVEATMYVVKEPKSRPPPSSAQQPQQQPGKQSTPQQPVQPPARPILQYGPPNGSMPPLPTPSSTTTTTPNITSATPKPAPPTSSQNSPLPSPMPPKQQPASNTDAHTSKSSTPTSATGLAAPPSAAAGVPSRAQISGLAHPPATLVPPTVSSRPPSSLVSAPTNAPPPLARPMAPPVIGNPANRPVGAVPPNHASPAIKQPAPGHGIPPAPASKPAPNDPVIALLAQKASGDAELRDLMKRVAIGQAREGELAHFQKIIDQLNAEYRRSGGQQGPSADRLLVDGRTVKYFADEVRTILDIVLASNPQQKSGDLRPPPRSDPLVVLLVKTALEDQRTKDMIRRIAEGRPGFTDATDLKDILDRLHRDAKTIPQGLPAAAPPKPVQQANGIANGHPKPTPPASQLPNSQALRSKGPPPAAKPDIAAVVFDFGSGDRYLFPKFSIVENLTVATGQEAVVSFLIVRKGSYSEYGGDPALDYYQPVTIRISTNTGRHLDNLSRVVALREEVQRYMDDVMDNMTRAEYVLLAMRLPRASRDSEKDDGTLDESQANGSTKSDAESERPSERKPSVLWTTTTSKSNIQFDTMKIQTPEDESEAKYRRLIRSVAARES